MVNLDTDRVNDPDNLTNPTAKVNYGALLSDIMKMYTYIFRKFKRKASESLTARPVPVYRVNPLAFKYSPIDLQPMSDIFTDKRIKMLPKTL